MLDYAPPPDDALVRKNLVSPVRVECVLTAAEYYKLPVAALVHIMDVEGGKVGQFSQNTNGSRDNGPMQVNSIHNKELAKFGISEKMVRNNGCLNVMVGAWILKKAWVQAKGNPWEAIGRYHSATPKFKARYQWKVYNSMVKKVDLNKIIKRANSPLYAEAKKRTGKG